MNKLSKISITIIQILHVLVMLAVLIIPFIQESIIIDIYYIIFIPFLLLHWLINNDNCALTIIENKLRGKKNIYDKNINTNFTYRFFKPIYTLPILLNSRFIYFPVIILYFIKLYKFINNKKYKEMIKQGLYRIYFSENMAPYIDTRYSEEDYENNIIT